MMSASYGTRKVGIYLARTPLGLHMYTNGTNVDKLDTRLIM